MCLNGVSVLSIAASYCLRKNTISWSTDKRRVESNLNSLRFISLVVWTKLNSSQFASPIGNTVFH